MNRNISTDQFGKPYNSSNRYTDHGEYGYGGLPFILATEHTQRDKDGNYLDTVRVKRTSHPTREEAMAEAQRRHPIDGEPGHRSHPDLSEKGLKPPRGYDYSEGVTATPGVWANRYGAIFAPHDPNI